jgi:DNA-directed RNA polymerase subunit RPC12/RpoP
MIYECAGCGKLFEENQGVMILIDTTSFLAIDKAYRFRCRSCMSDRGKKEFDSFRKKK